MNTSNFANAMAKLFQENKTWNNKQARLRLRTLWKNTPVKGDLDLTLVQTFLSVFDNEVKVNPPHWRPTPVVLDMLGYAYDKVFNPVAAPVVAVEPVKREEVQIPQEETQEALEDTTEAPNVSINISVSETGVDYNLDELLGSLGLGDTKEEDTKEEAPKEVGVSRIYTDGAHSSKCQTGGWGVYVESENSTPKELSGWALDTTNNKMELKAMERAFDYIREKEGVFEIYTDSQYVLTSLLNWEKYSHKGFGKAKNQEEIQEIFDIMSDLGLSPINHVEAVKGAPENESLMSFISDTLTINMFWVRGHNGKAGNIKADKLAVAARQCVKP